MVRAKTGNLAAVLRLPPNGSETSALPTFNSLANIVAHCVATHAGCRKLFDATTPPGGPRPTNVLQAVANIAKYPWLNVDKLFALSLEQQIYAPALAQKPDAWTLFLKFTGSFSSEQNADNLLNGPGAFAIDEDGFLWVSNNYIPEPPLTPACAGNRLLKFYPWGENFPGSPYFGGGLSGSGWGITLTPNGRVWVGNFGFTRPRHRLPPAPGQQRFGVPAEREAALARHRVHGGPDLLAAGHHVRPRGEHLDRQLRRRFGHGLSEGAAGQGVRDPDPAAGGLERPDEAVRHRDRSPGQCLGDGLQERARSPSSDRTAR